MTTTEKCDHGVSIDEDCAECRATLDRLKQHEVRHTPGPWEAGWGGGVSGARAAAYIDLTKDTQIARVPVRVAGRPEVVVEVAEYDLKVATPRMLADARLIASAPDLLEALKKLKAAVNDILLPELAKRNVGTDELWAQMQWGEAVHKTDMAIEMAEGVKRG